MEMTFVTEHTFIVGGCSFANRLFHKDGTAGTLDAFCVKQGKFFITEKFPFLEETPQFFDKKDALRLCFRQ